MKSGDDLSSELARLISRFGKEAVRAEAKSLCKGKVGNKPNGLVIKE